MSQNRNEKRNARKIQEALNLPYTMALRLLREGLVLVEGDKVKDLRNA